MLYCQQCGASNSGDARFCNQCGAKIADLGEPGGALDRTRPDTLPGTEGSEPHRTSVPSAPPAHGGFDVSTVSLSSIGVRSRGKAWGFIVLVALLLMGIGAGATWLGMQGAEAAPVATAEETEPLPEVPTEVEIGDLLPQGAEPPDVVTGTPRPAKANGGSTRPSTATKTGGSRGTEERASGGSSSGGSSSSGSSSGSSTGGSSSGGSSSGGSSSGGSSSGGASSGSSSSGGSSSGGSSSGGGSTRPEPDWDAMEDEVAEEIDYEMESYTTQVRSVVRNYYARRAQNCFDLATRNHDSVRGTVVIGFDIQADGEIVRPSVVRNTTGIESLGACLRGQVDTWRLPPPPEGRAPLPMQMPFSR